MFEITGTRGVLCIARGHGKISDRPPLMLYADDEMRGISNMASGWESSFVESTRHYIDALLAGGPPVLTGDQRREICASRWGTGVGAAGARGVPGVTRIAQG